MPEGRDADGGAVAADLLRTKPINNTASHRLRVKATRMVQATATDKGRARTSTAGALAKNAPAVTNRADVRASTSRLVVYIPPLWITAIALYSGTTMATLTFPSAIAVRGQTRAMSPFLLLFRLTHRLESMPLSTTCSSSPRSTKRHANSA